MMTTSALVIAATTLVLARFFILVVFSHAYHLRLKPTSALVIAATTLVLARYLSDILFGICTWAMLSFGATLCLYCLSDTMLQDSRQASTIRLAFLLSEFGECCRYLGRALVRPRWPYLSWFQYLTPGTNFQLQQCCQEWRTSGRWPVGNFNPFFGKYLRGSIRVVAERCALFDIANYREHFDVRKEVHANAFRYQAFFLPEDRHTYLASWSTSPTSSWRVIRIQHCHLVRGFACGAGRVVVDPENDQELMSFQMMLDGQAQSVNAVEPDGPRSVFTGKQCFRLRCTTVPISTPPVEHELDAAFFLGGLKLINYFHFTLTVLPKLIVCMDMLTPATSVVLYDHHDPKHVPDYVYQWLEVLGVDRNRILYSSSCKIDDCLYCGAMDMTYPIREPLQALRSFLQSKLNLPAMRERVIILQRRSSRRLENASELQRLLCERMPGHEVSIVLPETLTIPEQLQEFATAQLVVSFHGAGLANIVACSQQAALLEISDQSCPQPHHWHCAQCLGLEYFGMLDECSNFYTSPVVVNETKFCALLRSSAVGDWLASQSK